MLLFNCSNIDRQPPMFRKEFYIVGDGESRELWVDLEKAPVGMDFKGQNYPSAVYLDKAGPAVDMMFNSLMRVYFDTPPQKQALVRFGVSFYYASFEAKDFFLSEGQLAQKE